MADWGAWWQSGRQRQHDGGDGWCRRRGLLSRFSDGRRGDGELHARSLIDGGLYAVTKQKSVANAVRTTRRRAALDGFGAVAVNESFAPAPH